MYKVRAAKVIDAMRCLEAHSPCYTDVTIDQSRQTALPEGPDNLGPNFGAWRPPIYMRTKGPPPTRQRRAATPRMRPTRRAVLRTAGNQIRPGFRDEVRRLLETANVQDDKGTTHA